MKPEIEMRLQMKQKNDLVNGPLRISIRVIDDYENERMETFGWILDPDWTQRFLGDTKSKWAFRLMVIKATVLYNNYDGASKQ